MKKRLGCLHAHYSNIEYIDTSLSSYDIELIHFVDPSLMYQITSNENFTAEEAKNKVKEQMKWIARCNVDAILITCTNYIALLQEEELYISIPIIEVDKPYFEHICDIQQPQIILFTNPATVKGTMERLRYYAENYQKILDIKVIVINDVFELLMNGQKKAYNQAILDFLQNKLAQDKVISVAQLSMVDAVREAELMTAHSIINPLDTLIASIVNQLKLKDTNTSTLNE